MAVENTVGGYTPSPETLIKEGLSGWAVYFYSAVYAVDDDGKKTGEALTRLSSASAAEVFAQQQDGGEQTRGEQEKAWFHEQIKALTLR